MERHYALTYFAPPEQTLQIRDFLQEYMELDTSSAGKPQGGYPLYTIYLDSDDWRIYWGTIQRDQDCWKLRLRYDDNPSDRPVLLQVTHQMTDVRVEYQGGLKREALESVLAGHLPHPGQLSSSSPQQLTAVERFVRMMVQSNAKPKLRIFCLREAYLSHNDRCRLTLDRRVAVSELSGHLLAPQMDDPLLCVDHTVILELRFAERYPDWYREFVRVFNLSQSFPSNRRQQIISMAGLRLTPGDVIHNIVL